LPFFLLSHLEQVVPTQIFVAHIYLASFMPPIGCTNKGKAPIIKGKTQRPPTRLFLLPSGACVRCIYLYRRCESNSIDRTNKDALLLNKAHTDGLKTCKRNPQNEANNFRVKSDENRLASSLGVKDSGSCGNKRPDTETLITINRTCPTTGTIQTRVPQ